MPYAWRSSHPAGSPAWREPTEPTHPLAPACAATALAGGIAGVFVLPLILGSLAVGCGILGIVAGARAGHVSGGGCAAGILLGALALLAATGTPPA